MAIRRSEVASRTLDSTITASASTAKTIRIVSPLPIYKEDRRKKEKDEGTRKNEEDQ